MEVAEVKQHLQLSAATIDAYQKAVEMVKNDENPRKGLQGGMRRYGAAENQ